MSSARRPAPRLVAVLGSLLLILGLFAFIQAGRPAAAHASTAAPATTIKNEPCTANRSTWVHVYSVSDGTFCLGYAGTYLFNGGNGRWVNKITFGNNYGSMYFEFYSHGTLVPDYYNFDGADPYANEEDCTAVGGCFMISLTIDGWH